jgi:methenyltetrahydromethanopterin cyclohydrolase
MDGRLNERTVARVERLLARSFELKVDVQDVNGERLVDCGVKAPGGLEAGLELARVCLADLGQVSLGSGTLAGRAWPTVEVATDHPVAACLFSQYAGWQIGVGKFFAMGSGPMRAAAAREAIFSEFAYRETPLATVGVLEGGKLPSSEVFAWLAERTGVAASSTSLLVAPTASFAGSLQVVARVVETALHKLHEIGFDLRTVRSASGVAPFAPVAANDLEGIGRTNDAILYGGSVVVHVGPSDRGETGPNLSGDDVDDLVRTLGPKVPAGASSMYGRPFLEIFEAAGRDFYKIDPHLFSPGEITFCNVKTGRTQRFGGLDHATLARSFGAL